MMGDRQMAHAGRGTSVVLGLFLLCCSPEETEDRKVGGTMAGHIQAASVRAVFAGDILLDGVPGRIIADGGDPFAPIAPWLARADLAVGNLECPIAESGEAVEKGFTFRAHPRALPVLASHFGAVSLANNHAGDFGTAAFVETMRRLKAAKLPYFGAGNNLSEAHEPLILERRGMRIALLGYDEFSPRWFEAGYATPGIAWSEEEHVMRDIRRARKIGAHVVLPYMHWGWENEPKPCDRQRDLARRMIDAGADAVIGGHPHITQGAEIYRGKPIIYSLGNFVFDLLDYAHNGLGWLLRLDLDAKGVARWDTAVVQIDNGGVPRPMPNTKSPCGRRGDSKPGQCVVKW